MKRSSSIVFSADVPSQAAAALDAAGSAAGLAIDVADGRILAANEAAIAALDLPRRGDAGAAPVLDAATPALHLLRAMPEPHDEARATTLTFWTPRGAVRFTSSIRVLRHDGRTVAVLTTAQRTEQNAARGAATFDSDDHVKLKEIARRIREGLSASRGDGEAPARSEPNLRADAVTAANVDTHHASHVATLAHELKTPLTAIAAAAEIMKDERFGALGDARYLRYATDIHASAYHTLVLIERLLGGSATLGPPTGAMTFVEVDVGGLLESLLSHTATLAEHAGITLALHAEQNLPRVIADATSVRQMVLNLVTNALKATSAGGSIDVSAGLRFNGTLAITVADTGTGMTQRAVERLLRPPLRPIATTNGAHAGGIGLSLVLALAEANGAELSFESTPGAGTSASIVFGADRVVLT